MGRPKSTRICSVDACGAKHYGEGFCRNHFRRNRRNGTPDSLYDLSKYNALGGVKDTGKGRRGFLSVNVINDIKFKARKRGKEWALTHEQAFQLITQECTYCPFVPSWPHSRVGIDRVDNDVGYVFDNCVPCCTTCNSAKGEKTVEEFVTWLKGAHGKLSLK